MRLTPEGRRIDRGPLLMLVATAVLLTLYAAWRLFPALPLAQTSFTVVVESALAALAVFIAWRASRRTRGSARLSRAWLLIAAALAMQEVGSLFELVAELEDRSIPYPSSADVLYLAFYPLMLAGVLSFPTLRRTARERTELVLDCAIVGLGGAAVFTYFLLGPKVEESSVTLEAVVTIAYPVADVILIVALAAALLGSPTPSARGPLRWLIVAIGLLVLGDLIWGTAVLRGSYDGESLLNLPYDLSTAAIVVAAIRQRAVTIEEEPTRVQACARNAWLPYAAILGALVIFIYVAIDEPFFPNVLISAITATVVVLIVARQVVGLRALGQSRRSLAEAQQIAQLGSWEWDIATDRIEFSDEGARLLGFKAGTTLSPPEMLRLIEPVDRESLRRRLEMALNDHRSFALELRLQGRGEEPPTFVGRTEPIVKNDVVTGFRGTLQDITDRKRLEAQLDYQADHDPLTGLYNRRRFGRELERALIVARRYRRRGAVLMVDIDNFKTVNDTAGHADGDRVLKGVAAAVASRSRETDVFARIGGDEFAIVVPEASVEDARRVAEEIRTGARAADGAPRLSIGIAPFDGREPVVADDVMVAADVALYEAKELGRDQVVVYSGKAGGAMRWVERIRAALDEDRFLLYAQPMIDLETGEVSHKELLLRMVADDGEVIPPGAFLPTAERVGLITEIDRWVTSQGLRLARQGERLSINIAAPSIGDARILAMVRTAVEDGVDPSSLIFEITETAAMSSMQVARAFVSELVALGCAVALDDFGTGFGSFTYLKHLPANYLKIDMEFVSHLDRNATDREVVKSITHVAHSLGKRTVAEGVEDERTLALLREYGVDCAQGMLIGRPERVLPAEVDTPDRPELQLVGPDAG